MFKKKQVTEVLEKRLVVCVSSEMHILKTLLSCIDEDIATAVPVTSKQEYDEKAKAQELDDVVICSDVMDDEALVKWICEIPERQLVFLIETRAVNWHFLQKIIDEGVQIIDKEKLTELYSPEEERLPPQEEKQVSKVKEGLGRTVAKLKPKRPKLNLRGGKVSSYGKSKNQDEENNLNKEPDENELNHSQIIQGAVSEEESIQEDVIVKPKKIALKRLSEKKTGTNLEKERVIRKIKVTQDHVVVKKQVHTKLSKDQTTCKRVLITGLKESGKTTYALSFACSLANLGRTVALVDLDKMSNRNLASLCVKDENEDGLDKLYEGQVTPYMLDKRENISLFTSVSDHKYDSRDLGAMLSLASETLDTMVIDAPIQDIDPLQRYDHVVFIIDTSPSTLDEQMDALSELCDLKLGKISIIANKHTKSCISRRNLRKKVRQTTNIYNNNIHISKFSIKDLDYFRKAYYEPLDGSGLRDTKMVAKEVIYDLNL